MKKITFGFIILLSVTGFTTFGQESEQLKNKTFPLYWSFDFNNTIIQSSGGIENHRYSYGYNSGYSFIINWNLPLKKTSTFPRSGFSLAPGLGMSKITFCTNKDITLANDEIVVAEIIGSYNYSSLTGYYIDVPLDFRFRTKSNAKNRSFCFDIGGKAGRLLYAEKEIQRQNGDELNTQTSKNIDFLNSMHYAVTSKISYQAIGVFKNEAFGLAIFASCNYYFSNALIENDIAEPKLFSYGLGCSFLFE